MNNNVTLNELKIGQVGKVSSINTDTSIKRRLLDMGLVNNTEVRSVLSSSGNQTLAYLIRGAVIALRQEDASKINVLKVS